MSGASGDATLQADPVGAGDVAAAAGRGHAADVQVVRAPHAVGADGPTAEGPRAPAVLLALGFLLPGAGVQPAPQRLLPDGAGVARVDHAAAAGRAGPAHGTARPHAQHFPV